MKNVVITGTSRGIGFELAKTFASNNYNVVALSRNNTTLIDEKNITTIPFDLNNPKDFDKVTNHLKSENIDCVDILIHNAGYLVNKSFEEISQEDFIKTYQTNVFGVAQLTQTLLPIMNKDSHVVGISSIGGIQGSMKFPGLAAYSSSKGALITLFELLAEEYKERQISFNTLALGAVQTEMLEEAFPGFKAPVTPQEIAKYIYNFAIDGNRYFNGKVLEVSSSTP